MLCIYYVDTCIIEINATYGREVQSLCNNKTVVSKII